MKLIVAGGRDFNNYELLKKEILDRYSIKNLEIVCGKARGADTLGERFAKEFKLKIKYFPANWDLNGRSAGYVRNCEMAEYADCLIAFWDWKSKGTRHMIDLANRKNIKIDIINY